MTTYSPLFQAEHEARLQRHALIKSYQDKYNCNFIVMMDEINPMRMTYFQELIFNLDKSKDLHLMLWSPGGSGETAIKLARQAQAACKEFFVIVPDWAKSAGTIFALAAHGIIMGPTSDLGPIDPQIDIPNKGLVSAKNIIAAVENASAEVNKNPDSFPIQASLLGGAGIDSTLYEFAKSALAQTKDVALQALASNPDREENTNLEILEKISKILIEDPNSHGAVVGTLEAEAVGLPIQKLAYGDNQWTDIWHIWNRYFTLKPVRENLIYESAFVSQIIPIQ